MVPINVACGLTPLVISPLTLPSICKKADPKAVLSRMQLTLHATRPIPHGASRLVQAMSAWSVKTRPSQHCWDARVYGHTTRTAMHNSVYNPLPRASKCANCRGLRNQPLLSPPCRRGGYAACLYCPLYSYHPPVVNIAKLEENMRVITGVR